MKKVFLSTLLMGFLFCSNAQTGRVGIGTTTPAARLHVLDSSVLFSNGGTVISSTEYPPASGQGKRMMWWPARAAFRTGLAVGTEWDRDSIAIYSFAAGYGTKASGSGASTALGYQTTARGFASTAVGRGNTSNGAYSFSTGYNSTANGTISFVAGQESYAFAPVSGAMGYQDTAAGNASMALGAGLYTRGYGEVAVGHYNLNYTPVGPGYIAPEDRVFSVGTGYDNASRSSALSVFNNGNIVIGNIPNPGFQFSNTTGNTLGSDAQGGNAYGFAWRADQPGYAVQFFNGWTDPGSPNGLAVKVQSNAGTALDVSQGAQETLGTSLLIVKSAGNVGIGTNNPGAKLDVSGTIRATEVGTTETGNANMIAAAYGVVYSNTTNTIVSSSNNCTVSHLGGSGIYTITFTGSNLASTATGNLPIVISLYGTTPGFVSWTGGNGTITVYTFNISGIATDRGFSFAVYKP